MSVLMSRTDKRGSSNQGQKYIENGLKGGIKGLSYRG